MGDLKLGDEPQMNGTSHLAFMGFVSGVIRGASARSSDICYYYIRPRM